MNLLYFSAQITLLEAMGKGYYVLILCAALFASAACKQEDQRMDEPATATEGSSNPGDNAITRKGDTAEVYKELVSENEQPNRIIWQKPDLVLSKLGPLENRVVADIGAGTGYFSFRLARKGAKVIAIDIDPNAIEWMKIQKNRFTPQIQDNLDIRLAGPRDPNLKPSEADLVLMVNTYTYLRDRISYLVNLKKGIKPGARIVIIDFKKKNTTVGPPVEERLSLLQVESELKEAGYEIMNSDDRSLDFQYILTAANRG